MKHNYLTIIITLIIVNLTLAWQVYANGTPDSPGSPESTSSYTLADLYNRLSAGTTGSQSTFTEPSSGPGAGTMHSLNEIMAVAPVADEANGAVSTEVLSGKTFWGLRSGQWGQQTGSAILASGNATPEQVLTGRTFSNESGAGLTGTMPDRGALVFTPRQVFHTIPQGYHNGQGYVVGDPDLTAGNIRSGANIFGVNGSVIQANGNATAEQVLGGRTFSNGSGAGLTGTMPNRGAVSFTPGQTAQTIPPGYHNGQGTVAGDVDLTANNIKRGVNIFGITGAYPHASVPKTGQTTSYFLGDDGALEKGAAWPNPRFTDNGDGTVTDNLTGLIWLKNADCFGPRIWSHALSHVNILAAGNCGLTDGSSAGDWRLPSLRELQSLIHYGVAAPALPNTAGTGKWTAGDPFTGVQSSNYYWSSTTHHTNPIYAWAVFLDTGGVSVGNKQLPNYVWPVRGGQ